MATIIDPPSGWKYGFPKPMPEDRKNDVLVWLVEQGYPQSEIDGLGEIFTNCCRYWEEEEQITQVSLKEEAKQRAANYMSLKGALEPKDVILGDKTALVEDWFPKQERKYSEEDMINFAFDTYCYISELMKVPFNLISENKLHAMYNFEQFKNK